MPFTLLQPLNVYPHGEYPAGTVLHREQLPLGCNIEGLVRQGVMRPSEDESLVPAPKDAEGWQERCERAETQLKELRNSDPDRSAADQLALLTTEHERLKGAHENLRAEHEAQKTALYNVQSDRNEARIELASLKGESWTPPVDMMPPTPDPDEVKNPETVEQQIGGPATGDPVHVTAPPEAPEQVAVPSPAKTPEQKKAERAEKDRADRAAKAAEKAKAEKPNPPTLD